jgi:hypothetical protein
MVASLQNFIWYVKITTSGCRKSATNDMFLTISDWAYSSTSIELLLTMRNFTLDGCRSPLYV